MSKFAKIFEVGEDQVLITKETIDDDETGESNPGIILRTSINGNTITEAFSFHSGEDQNAAFDTMVLENAKAFRDSAAETFKVLLGEPLV